MVRCFLTVLQIVGLSLIWLAGDYLVRQFHLPIPANVTGMLLLLLLLLARVVNVNWLRDGATWLLAEMLLFCTCSGGRCELPIFSRTSGAENFCGVAE